MMRIFNSFKIAVAMYSKIPIGRTEWTKENMEYSMCFVPFIGMVTGALSVAWWCLCTTLGFEKLFFACVAVLIPLCITGGIHMDGFCDVVDAMSSYEVVEKKLEILKDPHIGAFALIWTVAYFVGLIGAFSQLHSLEGAIIIGIGYVVSRAVVCLLAITLKNAKREGTLYTFSSRQKKDTVAAILWIFIIMCLASMFIVNYKIAVLTSFACGIWTILFCNMSKKNFGGITGDLAGYFIQMCELVIAFAVILGETLCSYL